MPWRYHTLRNFSGGLNSRQDPRDTAENQLSGALGASVDKIGKIKTVGALASHGEVPTQNAVIAPGSGLKVYSSDHWRASSDTIDDKLADNNATADQRTEANATTGWSAVDGGVLASDTPANYGIASNSTTYVMRITKNGAGAGMARQSFATVIGQQYSVSADFFLDSGGDPTIDGTLAVGSTSGGTDLFLQTKTTQDAWTNLGGVFIATTTTTYIQLDGGASGTEEQYWDDIFVIPVGGRDIIGDWLALTDAANAQVDLYNDNDDSFSAGDIDFGTVSTYTATADEINFPTTSTITDASSLFLNNNMKPGDIWKISGCTTEAANNILIIIGRISADSSTITTRGAPLTVAADEDGTVTFTKYNPTAFHFVNEALRASPVGGGIALRPKHYSFVDRIHFGDALAFGSQYNNWFLNDVGPIAPTDQNVSTDAAGDRDITGDVTAGAGFELGISDNPAATGGEWSANTWEVASSFVLDDGQESALYIPSTAQTFTTTESSSQDIAVRAHNTGTSYDERISGARIYCRITLSDDPWTLLVDVDMKQGARATLSGNYGAAWTDGSTSVVYSDGFDSFRLNGDTYEGETGLFPNAIREGFEFDNRFWGHSVIAGNRCFLFSPRYTNESGVTSHFADRILHSEAGSYDIFNIKNYVDVVRGDADDYVAGAFWNGKLLCFKQRNLFVVDISDPDPAYHRLEKTYAFRGARLPGAIFPTPYGIAWCNDWGVWLYNGQDDPIDLLGDKIDWDDWNSFWTDYTLVGYYPKADLLILMRDATGQGGGTVDETMIFNFRLQAWTTADDLFDPSKVYTNFETDWNQDLIIGVQTNSTTVTIQKYTDTPTAQTANNIDWKFQDIDFGNPMVKKTIDSIAVTYKSSAAQTTPISYAIDGHSTTFTNLTGDMSTKTDWEELVMEPTSFECYSLRLRVRNPTSTGTIEINDLSIRYFIEPEDIT